MTYKSRAPFPSAAFVESQRNFTYFDKSLTSGLSDVTIESPGDFLYIDQASTGYVYVELNQRQSGTLAPILLAAGGSIECDFASVKLYAPAQPTASVRIVIGNGARIKGGANVNAASMTISVADAGRLRSLQNKSFWGTVGANAVAGQVPMAQLFNPAASGKTLYLREVTFGTPTAQLMLLCYTNTAFSNNSSNVRSKYAESGGNQGQVRSQTAAAVVLDYYMSTRYVTASQSIIVPFDDPVVIPSGYGLAIEGQTANSTLQADFVWDEV